MKKIELSFIFLCLWMSGCTQNNQITTTSLIKDNTISIGALFNLSASDGIDLRKSAELAIKDANEEFKKTGKSYEAKLIALDTTGNQDRALENILSLVKQDIRLVVGPTTSGEARWIRAEAARNNVLIISNSSTTPSLGEEDNIYRLVPNDLNQAEALAKQMANDGIKAVLKFKANNIYSSELSSNLVQNLIFGGITQDNIRNIRYIESQNNFDEIVAEAEESLKYLVSKVGEANKVAVILVSYGFDAINIIAALNKLLESNKSSPFNSVKWYSGDGLAESDILISNIAAAEFVASKNILCSEFTPDDNHSSGLKSFYSRVGVKGDVYNATAYDAVKLAIQTAVSSGSSTDPKAWKENLVQSAKTINGLTGHLNLDANGDRSSKSYAFWKIIKNSDGSYSWAINNRSSINQ